MAQILDRRNSDFARSAKTSASIERNTTTPRDSNKPPKKGCGNGTYSYIYAGDSKIVRIVAGSVVDSLQLSRTGLVMSGTHANWIGED